MSELIKHFGIDWRLLLAQAVNFLILLWILKRFAYGPILRLLKRRKEEIEKGLRYTKEAEEALANVGTLKERILSEARSEALKIVSAAENAAKKRKEEILQEASQKAEVVVMEAKRLIAGEKAKMKESIYEEAEEMVRLGITKVLGKMPSEERDRELIREALQELKSIS